MRASSPRRQSRVPILRIVIPLQLVGSTPRKLVPSLDQVLRLFFAANNITGRHAVEAGACRASSLPPLISVVTSDCIRALAGQGGRRGRNRRALGVPHTPFFPSLVEQEGSACETARFFAALTRELEAMQADLLVMYDTDHLNTFFFDNLPIFAVGLTDAFNGPNDEPRAVPIYTIQSQPDVAGHIRHVGVEAGFDLALAQEFT